MGRAGSEERVLIGGMAVLDDNRCLASEPADNEAFIEFEFISIEGLCSFDAGLIVIIFGVVVTDVSLEFLVVAIDDSRPVESCFVVAVEDIVDVVVSVDNNTVENEDEDCG